MNEYLTFLLFPIIVLLAAAAFAFLVKKFLFLRKHLCPKCGEEDEVPSLLFTYECQNCGTLFDVIAGRRFFPRHWVTRAIDHIITLMIAGMFLMFVAEFVPLSNWVFIVLTAVVFIDLLCRRKTGGLPFGVEQSEPGVHQIANGNSVRPPGDDSTP